MASLLSLRKAPQKSGVSKCRKDLLFRSHNLLRRRPRWPRFRLRRRPGELAVDAEVVADAFRDLFLQENLPAPTNRSMDYPRLHPEGGDEEQVHREAGAAAEDRCAFRDRLPGRLPEPLIQQKPRAPFHLLWRR